MSKQILISGSTGLIGKALTKALRISDKNYTVWQLTTSTGKVPGGIRWNPSSSVFISELPTKVDAVIHLAGAPLDLRWTKKMKDQVYTSRVQGAQLLADWLDSFETKLTDPRPTFICTSAVGYYGTPPSDYSGPPFTETSRPFNEGTFLGKVSSDCERACDLIRDRVRVIHPRFGVVLDPSGGALKEMLLPFKLGLGGPMGSGQQMFPWVSLRDVVAALVFMLENPQIEGAVNVVAPTAAETSQKQFAKALGKALHRPAAIPVPAFALKGLIGSEAAEAMLLSSIKVAPRVLTESGFKFQDPKIEECLQNMLR